MESQGSPTNSLPTVHCWLPTAKHSASAACQLKVTSVSPFVALLLQPLLPPLQAASQLSQAELEELLAENAKLKQLLSTYKDRLAPEQVRGCAAVRLCGIWLLWKGCCVCGVRGTVGAV
jgi:hypothetical protein